MKNKPIISIITPTYNHEEFIEKCIESVLAQSYPNWEQIIIDDGSTDNTREKVLKFKDKRIKYIKQGNLGIENLNKTYNKALKISKGNLIAILEGDDFWPSDKLKKQINSFNDPEVVLSWGKAITTDFKGNPIDIEPKDSKLFKNKPKNILKELLFQNSIPASTVMCRKKALIKIGGFKQPIYSPYVDYPTWLELSLIGKFYFLNTVLGYWRRHENQTSTIKLLKMVEAKKYSIEFYNQLPSSLKNSIGINIYDLKLNNQYFLASKLFHLGRVNLTNREWDKSKNYFKEAFSKGSNNIKIISVVGLVFAYLKLDLDYLIKLFNKKNKIN